MRILVLQFVPAVHGRPAPRFDPQLGTLLSLLRERGHTLGLVGLDGFELSALKRGLAQTLPQIIYADISPVCHAVARRVLQYLKEKEFIPVIAGGGLTSLDPHAALSLPGVRAAALGEPDASLIAYLERMRDPALDPSVWGVWSRDETGLTQPPMPPLVEDLDSLPLPERELFNYSAQVQRSGELEIAVGRGCPQRCAYCLLPPTQRLYEGRGLWVRRRSAASVFDEIRGLRERYANVRSLRFLDHSFALDPDWIRGFCEAYRERCGLPFRCHLRANASSDAVIHQLAFAGCRDADVEVISGSNFIRNEILAMDLSDEQIRRTVACLRDAGIRARAVVYLGAPYESEVSLEETLRLLTALAPAQIDARPYFPFPGTAAAKVCTQNGWVHARGEQQYHQEKAGLDMPACRPALIERALRKLRRQFRVETGEPWWRRWAARPR